jgi:hypothetical protein
MAGAPDKRELVGAHETFLPRAPVVSSDYSSRLFVQSQIMTRRRANANDHPFWMAGAINTHCSKRIVASYRSRTPKKIRRIEEFLSRIAPEGFLDLPSQNRVGSVL